MAIELHLFTRNGLSGTCMITGVPAQDITAFVYGTKLNQPGGIGSADHPVAVAGQRNGSGLLVLNFTALAPAPDQPVLIFGVGLRLSPLYIDYARTTCGPIPDHYVPRPAIIPRRKPEIIRR